MLLAHVPPLLLTHDSPVDVELQTPTGDHSGSRLSFGRLKLEGHQASLQLMAIARNKSPPEIWPPALLDRQRGPHLYIFDVPDAAAFEGLARLLAECVRICGLRKLL